MAEIQNCRQLSLGQKLTAAEAVLQKVAMADFKSNDELESIIAKFTKSYAPKAANRLLVSEMKRKMYWSLI